MLVHLHVKNLALIEEIEVDFGPGLNILTGETGAGKSILLSSMQLILGGKVSKDMIRENAPYALVELLFEVKNTKAEEALKELEIFPEEGQILLSRKITGGRNINRINGETVTVSRMKAVAACLLDIHGQHEHQSLLYQEKQLEILDIYGKEKILPIREKVTQAYQEYRKCKQILKEMDLDEEQRKREMAFLEFEIGEIEKACLIPGEDEELEKTYRRLSNSKKIVGALQMIYGLTGYDSGQGAGELTGKAIRELSRVSEYDSELESMQSSLQEIDALLNDFNREISSYMDNLTFDEQTFYEIENRLDLLNSLKSRYGQSIELILSYRDKQQKKLEHYLKFAENLEIAHQNLAKAEEKLEKYAYDLSKIRKEYSEQLVEKVVNALKDLNFLDVDFSINFTRKKIYTANGYDEVEYEISTNPGEARKPLGKIVSGGELSRIMLALKAILADRDQIETLIFDEIDAGISGRTAWKVSEKLGVLSGAHQVICITHLPQIAAMADSHYVIEKQTDGISTTTNISRLKEDGVLEELARLLGTDALSEAALQNARDIKEQAKNIKSMK